MKTALLTTIVSIALVGHVAADGAAAIAYDVEPDALAKEFDTDAKAAANKYDPNPPKGGAGGAVINIDGPVEVKGGKVYLKTTGTPKILLEGATPPKAGKKWAAVIKAGKFKGFKGGVISLEGTVKYEEIIGK